MGLLEKLFKNIEKNKVISEEREEINIESKETSITKANKTTYSKLLSNCILKWAFYDENIYILPDMYIDYERLSLSNKISFIREPSNEYDSNAVKVMHEDIFIGYLYKGKIQDMVNEYIDKEEYTIISKLNYIDSKNKKLTIQIAFYKEFDDREIECKYKIKATLTKTSKKDEYLDRQDSYISLEEGDFVEIETNYESDNYVVLNDCGEELGELSASISEKIEEYYCESEVFGKIVEITESDNGKQGAKIEIFVI